MLVTQTSRQLEINNFSTQKDDLDDKQKITRNQLNNRIEGQQLPEIDGSKKILIIHAGAWSMNQGSLIRMKHHEDHPIPTEIHT